MFSLSGMYKGKDTKKNVLLLIYQSGLTHYFRL